MTTHTPLKRSMRTFGALLITLSAVTPASSVFIIAPGVVQQAGTGAFLSFALAAIVGIFTALVYAELASAFPLAGGEYSIIGRLLGPLWGTITLGVNLITVILSLALLSVGIGAYIRPLFPGIGPVTAGIVTLGITTLCGILHIRTNAVVTGFFLCIELLALAILAYLGFSHIERPLADLVFSPVHLGDSGGLEPASFSVVGLATAVAMLAYNGYGQAVYLGEEIHNAPKRMARTILLALAISIIAEAVPVTAVLLGAPDIKSLLASPAMLSDFIALKGGARLNAFISLSIALAIMNANIAFIIMIARVLFSTGRDRIWTPRLNHALTRIHGHFHSPWAATLVCGGLGMAACFIDQNMLLVISGTGIVVIYSLLAVAVIAGRRAGGSAHGLYRMPFYPFIPVAALGMMGYVVYANFLDSEVGRPSLFATMGMMVLSAFYYVLVLRRRSDWTLHIPPVKELLK